MNKKPNTITFKILETMSKIFALASGVILFFPSLNSARATALINHTMSLFTSAVSYSRLISEAIRAIRLARVAEWNFIVLYISSIIVVLGILSAVIGAAFQVGNLKFKNLASKLLFFGSIAQMIGTVGHYLGYYFMHTTSEQAFDTMPIGIYFFGIFAAITFVISLVLMIITPKAEKAEAYRMDQPMQLLVMFLPFAILAFVFNYLPLWGWRYAFFDYTAGQSITIDDFVGFKYLGQLVNNAQTRRDIGQVMINTFVMSGLGLAFSWLPMIFAMFLAEISSRRFKKFVQFFTTIPNFISWVLVFALALAMFQTDGFINGVLMQFNVIEEPIEFLRMGDTIWLQMWAWGTWKSLGWSAIIYIAAISSIDPVMYESATVDGANRFQKMRFITLPSILPTYFVLLVLQVAAILSNGMDQYLVFYNAFNKTRIQVLDLYVYKLGIDDGLIPLSTLIGMLKSLISIALLFTVNKISKLVRGESIL